MNGRADDGPQPADADRDGGGQGSGMRLWWWLPVLAVAIVVAVILVRGGDDDAQPTGVGTPSLEPIAPGEAETGSMTIGGERGEPLLEQGELSDRIGEEVIGTLVPVDSVVAEGVLWVGEGRAQILLLEPEDEATPVHAGDVITFRGTLRALDDDARNAVWGSEAESRIEAQGAYVAVDELAAGDQ